MDDQQHSHCDICFSEFTCDNCFYYGFPCLNCNYYGHICSMTCEPLPKYTLLRPAIKYPPKYQKKNEFYTNTNKEG